jgi:anaerobic magnesium-protoporphyrin IX monomethyl ester cyclase
MPLSIRRRDVLIIVPPNSNTVIEGQLLTVTRPTEHSDWSDFMSLGALGMACALNVYPHLRPVYVDGTVISLDTILSYITDNCRHLIAVCVSVLTANYEAGLIILRHTKSADPNIVTIIGNDHFTALPRECMILSDCIDFGFCGNEVVGSFTKLIGAVNSTTPIHFEDYPSLVTRDGNFVHKVSPQPESVFSKYNYGIIDNVFHHTPAYTDGFKQRIAPRIKELLGRTVTAGVPIDIGRGCVKFANDNACSFCSIQYGGMWKNPISPQIAWNVIHSALHNGFDYLYITADELPLTFDSLLAGMAGSQPDWWRSLSRDERPLLVGYARADGIADARKTCRLVELGIRQVMIGMDAGSPVSLAAMNKPLKTLISNFRGHAEKLHAQNSRAISVARDEGMLIRAGFVLGHIGMTSELLNENVQMMKELLKSGTDVISSVDVEVSSPTPGSLDFRYLTTPRAAQSAADRLGLVVGTASELEQIAGKWRDEHITPPELVMRDFVTALMPGVQFRELADARVQIRSFARNCGMMIGE